MTTNQNNDDEIEIGKLFQLIGRGFGKFFNFIGKFFYSLFKFLIIVLLFLRRHFVVLFLSLIIGGVLGYLMEGNKRVYESSMVVVPNFKSVRQLYKDIKYFDNLVRQKDTITLSKIFNFSTKKASLLKSFSIEPIINYRLNLEAYNTFVEKSDTTTVKQITFKNFLKKQSKYDNTYQKISVKSTDNKLFSKLKDGIIKTINSNKYLVSLKEVKALNIEIEKNLTIKNLAQTDSLRKVYNKVMIIEANKPFNGTNIDMAQGKDKTNKELELFNIQNAYKQELITINNDKTENKKILNIISDFSNVGTKRSIIYQRSGRYAYILFGLTLFVLLGLELNKYLKKYQK